MDVHPEVYKWLGLLQLVDGAAPPPPVTSRGLIALDDDAAVSFENGQVRAHANPHPSLPRKKPHKPRVGWGRAKCRVPPLVGDLHGAWGGGAHLIDEVDVGRHAQRECDRHPLQLTAGQIAHLAWEPRRHPL